MKLLWLAHEGGMSGANICLMEYIRILRDSGHEQFLIVPSRGELAVKAEAEGIPVSCIPFYSWASSLGAPSLGPKVRLRRWLRNRIAMRKILALVKKTEPDRMLTNTIAISIGAFAADRAGIRHIWFIHEFGEEDHGFTIAGDFARGAKTIDKLSFKIVYNSLAVERKFAPFMTPGKGHIVYYPLVVPERRKEQAEMPSEAAPLKLIMLGQIAPSKDQLEAVNALGICRDKGLRFELNIVGKADQPAYLQRLEEAIYAAGLAESIHFRGSSSDPASWLLKSHVLLMCSRMEAFGRVTVEALKLGLPVIAANTGGSLELIRHGDNGYLYRKGDAADLAFCILQLQKDYEIFDPEKIARTAGEDFNIGHTAGQLEKVLS